MAVPDKRKRPRRRLIGWAVEQPYIDPRQIIAWGTSFAGMHVLEFAVSDNRLAAAVAQRQAATRPIGRQPGRL